MSKTEIDLKDRKILFELDFSARQTDSEISRSVGLSKAGVRYKIQDMVNNKILLGFYPIINLTKLGFVYGRVFVKSQNLTQEKAADIFDKLRKEKAIKWILECEGSYDIGLGIWSSSLRQFKKEIEKFVSKYGFYVKEKKESIGIDVAHFQSRYLLNKKETREIHIEEEDKTEQIDAVDKKILEVLCQNARMSLVNIAAKLKIQSNVVAYRIRRMEEKGIVLGYRPLINNNILGFNHYKIFFHLINVTEKDLIRLKQYIKSSPNVVYIVDEIGICDIDIEAMFQSIDEYFEFIKQLKFAFPSLIRDYETIIIKDTVKITYLPF